ncbi:MAG: aldo/keto reductase [Candidatus Izimaplasma sp.]|nr:aldo/keto reductase [Candidatus Izimaplasma bacterium]
MKKQKISNLNINVSLLGFGCMRFPMKEGKVDVLEVKKMLDYAYTNGVNYFDTAYPYHNGESEIIVGNIIKHYDRETFYLADKLPLWECENEEDIDRIFYEQLEKCGVDYFDFYLIHAANRERLSQVKELNVLKKLEQYKKDGKIKYIGFSFHDNLDTFKKWVDLYQWDFVQIQLNYMDVDHQQGIEGYRILTEKGIPVIVMEPVKGGGLVKFNKTIEKIFNNYNNNTSIASWAFRWVGSLPNVKIILSGMSTMEQLEDNLNTFSDFQPLNQEEQNIIKRVRREILDLSKVDCTSCNYCMPCPHGVDIPGNFRLYNAFSMYQNKDYIKGEYNNLMNSNSSANVCIDCGECLPKCPQQIQIPSNLMDMQKYFKENGIIE